MYICIYVYMYICIYVYMYICIYVYIAARRALAAPGKMHKSATPQGSIRFYDVTYDI